MVLKEVLKNLKNVNIIGDENINVKDIFSDSKLVTKDSLFVSISNSKDDKYNEVTEAVKKGAAVIVLEDEALVKEIPKDVVKVLVGKTNIAKAAIACNFFENPSTKMHVIGITGTRGKTFTAMVLREILVTAGKKVGLITNLYNAVNNKIISKEKEFLEAIDLQRLLAQMLEEKIEYVILEVPETSIAHNRVLGCKFANIIFTNLNSDDIVLGEKQSLESYIENQKKIFKWSDLNIINNDDFFAEEFIKISKKAITYGVANKADYTSIDINCRSTRVDYLTFIENKSQRIVVNMPGRFMVYNSLSAIALAMQLAIASKYIIKAMENLVIPGVYEVVENKAEIPVIINSAKTIKEIEETLLSTRPYSTGKITTVIGCDNNASSNDKEFIGGILGNLSDNTIVTTYNPRDKDPNVLGQELLQSIRKVNGKGIQIVDRKEAIEFALSKAQKRDLILLLGMGNEKFLEIGDEHIVLDERKIVEDFLSNAKPITEALKEAMSQPKIDLKKELEEIENKKVENKKIELEKKATTKKATEKKETKKKATTKKKTEKKETTKKKATTEKKKVEKKIKKETKK